jgi:hypothetical protein
MFSQNFGKSFQLPRLGAQEQWDNWWADCFNSVVRMPW